MGHTKSRARCSVCGKPCGARDRNTDGTYTHEGCLRATQVSPVDRTKTGGNIYGYEGEK